MGIQKLESCCTGLWLTRVFSATLIGRADKETCIKHLRTGASEILSPMYLHHKVILACVTDSQLEYYKSAIKDGFLDDLGLKIISTTESNNIHGEKASGRLHILQASPLDFISKLYPTLNIQKPFTEQALKTNRKILSHEEGVVGLKIKAYADLSVLEWAKFCSKYEYFPKGFNPLFDPKFLQTYGDTPFTQLVEVKLKDTIFKDFKYYQKSLDDWMQHKF